MKKLLLGTGLALGLGLAGSAYSADLPMKTAPVAQPVAAPVPWTWTGFYIGGHGGYGWARESFEHLYDPQRGLGGPRIEPFSGIHERGAIFGGQFGYNWQPYANWVVGVEADVSGTTIKRSETHSAALTFTGTGTEVQTDTTTGTVESKVRDLGTLRGKIGFAPWSNILFYGTGGLAWGQIAEASLGTINIACTGGTSFCGTFISFQETQSFSQTTTQFGWAAGAGVDWKWGNLILGVLYLHYDLGKTGLSTSATFATSCNTSGCTANTPVNPMSQFPPSHVTADAITARLSWLFTMPAPAPILARY